jgi:HD-GYP domain-containing protein (c-di-GMP phosphodiesterase class II)
MVVAIAAAYVITKIMFDTVEDRFNNQLIEAGKITSAAMVREEERLLNTLRLIAFTTGLPDALSARDAEQLRTLAYPLAVNRAEEAVEILDAQGQLVLSMRHRNGGNVEDYDFTGMGGEALRSAAFVQQVLMRQIDVRGDKYAGLIQATWGTYVYVAGPIQDSNNNLVGVVLVGRSVSGLARQIREESLAQITLYTFSGETLGTTFAETPTLAPTIVQDVLGRQSQDSYRRSLSQSNIDYVELVGAWQARGGAELGVVGAALPQTFLVRTTFATRTQILAVIAAALFLIMMIGYLVSSRITRPLLRVVRAAMQVACGDLTVQVQENTDDEVAVLARSFNHMIASLQRSQQQLIEAYDLTLEGWSRALELRDEETEGHTQRTTEMTVRLARALGVSANDLVHIRRGAVLHDIGKMGVPDAILRKPGPLTVEERNIMRQHPDFAYRMLSPIEFLHPALDIPYCHHERWDGGGYPRQLKGEQIPLAARIFAVVDVWDALSSDRPYRAALAPEVVRQHLVDGAGSHFDPNVVETFLRILDETEVGAPAASGSEAAVGTSVADRKGVLNLAQGYHPVSPTITTA